MAVRPPVKEPYHTVEELQLRFPNFIKLSLAQVINQRFMDVLNLDISGITLKIPRVEVSTFVKVVYSHKFKHLLDLICGFALPFRVSSYVLATFDLGLEVGAFRGRPVALNVKFKVFRGTKRILSNSVDVQIIVIFDLKTVVSTYSAFLFR
jgi:hypothetical protein